ncbi:MAG TPA: dethiobiotin synthase [Terriglobia bacterium]|nr:dethiobiotin synthase [Terriglobia bacterium]
MKTNLFITGTDTSVGKTVLCALLTAALDATYWKPVQSGAVEGTDRDAVCRWAEVPREKTLEECYCFDPGVSPHLAARQAGVRIDLHRIQLPALDRGGRVIAEGAGGILTPLNETETMLDLAVRLQFPVIVAAKTALGTINHTLLTLRALRAAGKEALGVVMLGPENLENRLAIERYGKIPVIGYVPWLPSINRNRLVEVFQSNFEKSYFV